MSPSRDLVIAEFQEELRRSIVDTSFDTLLDVAFILEKASEKDGSLVHLAEAIRASVGVLKEHTK